jgi:hypothetical protein
MKDLQTTLYDRVDELINAPKGSLLSTTGTDAAIAELVARTQGLENAIRTIALELQALSGRNKIT